MRINKKHLIVLFFMAIFSTSLIISASAEILPPTSKTLNFKQNGDNYSNVNHGGYSEPTSYVYVQIDLGPPKRARITSFKIECNTYSLITSLPSTLKEMKIYITLYVGSSSQTYSKTVWSGSDTNPWDIDRTWTENSAYNWLVGSGTVSVKVKTEIKRHQWWYYMYQSVTSTLTWF